MLEAIFLTYAEQAGLIYQHVMNMLDSKEPSDLKENERVVKKIREESKATQPVYEIITDYNLGTKLNLMA
jgi:hypothetical protein